MNKKQALSWLLTLCMIFVLLPMHASAEEAADSGTCGESATWTLEDGVLTISGTGPMDDFMVVRDPVPWFDARESIVRVVIEPGITYIGNCAFNSHPALESIEIPDTVQGIGRGAFTSCESLTGIELPEGITVIRDTTFSGTGLTGITIPSTVTTIEMMAFSNCKALTSITIPDSVTDLGYSTFLNCTGLVSVQLGTGITVIGTNTFHNCSALASIEIPASVTRISEEAFAFCSSLREIVFRGKAPTIGSISFFDVTANAYYPAESPTWTEEVMQQYSGTLTWIPYNCTHAFTITATTDPDCIHPGSVVSTCSLCGYVQAETFSYPTGQHTYLDNQDISCEVCGSTRDLSIPTTPMYRLYNPNTGEHFYTGSLEERDNLITEGWTYEGIAWNAPTQSGAPVHRLYNPNSGDHHYTMSTEERDNLVDLGWKYEGICWNSASASHLPLYRLYNPNADCGSHHYTGSEEERDNLVAVGWIYEGIGWYGMLK